MKTKQVVLRGLWWLFSILVGYFLSSGIILLIMFQMIDKDMFYPIPVYDMSEESKGLWSSISFRDMESEEYINIENLDENVIFINFWATWCKPCIAEMPSIKALQQKFKNKSVKFILASDEQSKIIENFVRQKQFNLPFFKYNAENLPQALMGQSLPRTYLVVNQEVVYQHTGGANWNSPEFVEKLNYYLKKSED